MRMQPMGVIMACLTVMAASMLVIVFAIGLAGGQYAGGPLLVIAAVAALTAAAFHPFRRVARHSSQ